MTARLRRVRRSLDYSIDRLAHDLAEDGESVERDDAGAILLLGDRVESWDPPVRLAFTDDELRTYLLSMEDARDVFPEVDAVQAAYQLFLVHLDEELATAAKAGSSITMSSNRLDVDPVREPEPWPDLDPDGDYAWMASLPDGSNRPLEFLSPGQYRAKYRSNIGRGLAPSEVESPPPEA